MRRLTSDPVPSIALARDAAAKLASEMRERLQPVISELDDTRPRELPHIPPVQVVLNGQAVLELTAREALDFYYAFAQLLEEGASGTAEHTHVYAEDYVDEFVVWIDPDSRSRASIT